MRSILTRAASVAALAVAVSATASAQNLVQNGGFETGDFTGWYVPADAPCYGPSIATGYAHSGTYSASYGQVSCWGELAQDVATTPGQSYTISFWGRSKYGEGPNGFRAYFGDTSTPMFEVDNIGADYTEYTFTGVATSASTTLRFDGYNNPEYNQLDDVSVVATTTTPEPSSIALLGTGLVGLVPMVRRRRK